MALSVVERGKKHIVERDDTWAPGRYRATFTIHDQHYLDDVGQWQPVDESLVTDGLDGFTVKTEKIRHRVRIASGGTRRWYPRRWHLTEYIDAGLPQYWTGSKWQNLNIGSPVVTGNIITWDRPTFTIRIAITWRTIKVDYILKNSSAPVRIRWAISLTGVTANGLNFISTTDAALVGFILPIIATDANDTSLPVTQSYSGGYLEFTVNTTGAIYPITVDPTFTDGFGGDVTTYKDARLNQTAPTENVGAAVTVGIGGFLTGSPDVKRMILEFNVSSLAGYTINTATLSIYKTADTGSVGDIDQTVRRVTRSWVEGDGTAGSGVTWNSYDGTNNWTTAGGDYAGSYGTTTLIQGTQGYYNWTVTTLVSEWCAGTYTNYGVIMHRSDADTSNRQKTMATSDNATTGQRPKLVVDYTAGTDKTVTDTGSSVDATPTIAAGLTLTDTSSGTDSATSYFDITLTETSSGSDSVAVENTITLSETWAGSEATPTVTADITVTDSGSGTNVATNLTADFTLTDTASGSDVATSFFDITLADTSSGSDATPTIVADITITDEGRSIYLIQEYGYSQDAITVDTGSADKTITDSWAGSEAFSITAAFTLADSGAGSDVATSYFDTTVTDTASGTDATPTVAVTVSLTDSGSGTDSIAALTVDVTVSQAAAGTDSVSVTIEGSDKTVTDTGSSGDSLTTTASVTVSDVSTGTDVLPTVAVTLTVTDTTAGTDAPSIEAGITVTDSSTGSEVISIQTGAVIDKSVTDIVSATDTLARYREGTLRKSNLRFGVRRTSAVFSEKGITIRFSSE